MSNQPRQTEQGGKQPGDQNKPGARGDDDDLDPAEERGERLDTGKTIARGGKEEGHVPGAEPT